MKKNSSNNIRVMSYALNLPAFRTFQIAISAIRTNIIRTLSPKIVSNTKQAFNNHHNGFISTRTSTRTMWIFTYFLFLLLFLSTKHNVYSQSPANNEQPFGKFVSLRFYRFIFCCPSSFF